MNAETSGTDLPPARDALSGLAELIGRLGRCCDLDEVLTCSLDALADLFGFEHSILLMLDERGSSLYTIATRGYERPGIGSEVRFGAGIVGKVAAEGRPMRANNLQRMLVYARRARESHDPSTAEDTEIPLPGLPKANSQMAAPAMVMGELVGVLAVESAQLGAFSAEDEYVLSVVAHLLANAIDLGGVEEPERAGTDDGAAPAVVPPLGSASTIRFFAVDGSTFIDDDYLIKGVAGRILWRLAREYVDHGRTEFTNREIRLDPTLELPTFRDNLESRLVLLKRRLDERGAPLRIERTARGRFRIEVGHPLRLEGVGA
ncbi:MAG: hypothetical protein QOG65_2398 [Actinomycetota bacterium]|jgi:adenylate cyclase|nr:hypothetical protein [Actinomycetota bacterium]